jgi:A/G-specific adenine glycosylase
MLSPFSSKLLNWYSVNARELPWRDHPNPYAVWVSEIMLQQTRIESVIPYFQRWMTRFPTISDLAAASQQEVLSLWEGLGYYSRARNLHHAAKIVIEVYEGKLPQDAGTLRKLPGVGRYTAAAIASIAFGQDEPALDGNIRRVLSRVFNLIDPVGSTKGTQKLWKLAGENLPPGRAGDYNQAIMDLGAMICTPRSPDCAVCPVAGICQAKALGVEEDRPVPKLKVKIPHHIVTAAVIQKNGRVMVVRRPPDGLLGGMWEFPGGKQEPEEDLPTCLRREILEELGVEILVGEPFGVYRHAYTHFRVTLHAYLCSLNGGQPQLKEHIGLCWVDPVKLNDFPMGKIDRQIANQLILNNRP